MKFNKKLLIAGLILTMGMSTTAFADTSKNPYGLVYQGAITQNVLGKVNIHPVNYNLNGLKIAANVYTPADYDVNKKYPAVVVAHPMVV